MIQSTYLNMQGYIKLNKIEIKFKVYVIFQVIKVIEKNIDSKRNFILIAQRHALSLFENF